MSMRKKAPDAAQNGDEGVSAKSNVGAQDTFGLECMQDRMVPWHRVWDDKQEKYQKVPFDGQYGLSTKNPAHWMTHVAAQRIVADYGLDGIGIVMTGGIRQGYFTLVGIDVDKVTADFKLPFDTYSERSPSGKGIRAFVWVPTASLEGLRDTVLKDVKHCKQVELYIGSAARFLTVTGDRLNDLPIAHLQDLGDWKLKPAKRPADAAPPIVPGSKLDLSKFHLRESVRRLLDGEGQPVIDRSDEVYHLVVELANQGASKENILATLLRTDATWAYCIDHRDGEDGTHAAQFAEDEVNRIYPASGPGVAAQMCEITAQFPKRSHPAQQDDPEPLADPEVPKPLLIERPLSKAILTTPVPAWESVIGRFLPISVVTELNGAHGIGKSTCALHMACCVATGRDYMGLPRGEAGKAVFCTKEDPYNVVVLRIQDWVNDHPEEERDDLRDLLVKNLLFYGSDETEDLMLTATDGKSCVMRHDAIDECTERWRGARLVVLETASMLHAGDEMNEHLQVLVNVLKRIAGRLQAAVVLIRHISKTAVREAIEDSLVGRGGAAFSDSARSVILIRELSEKEASDMGVDLHKLNSGGENDCALLKVVNTKNNYLRKEKTFFVLRMGTRYSLVEPRGEQVVTEERLMLFLRKELALGNTQWSFSALRAKHKEIGVKQLAVEGALRRLTEAGKLTAVTETKGGTHTEWVLKT